MKSNQVAKDMPMEVCFPLAQTFKTNVFPEGEKYLSSMNPSARGKQMTKNDGFLIHPPHEYAIDVHFEHRKIADKPLIPNAGKAIFPRPVVYELAFIKAEYRKKMLALLKKEREEFAAKLNRAREIAIRRAKGEQITEEEEEKPGSDKKENKKNEVDSDEEEEGNVGVGACVQPWPFPENRFKWGPLRKTEMFKTGQAFKTDCINWLECKIEVEEEGKRKMT